LSARFATAWLHAGLQFLVYRWDSDEHADVPRVHVLTRGPQGQAELRLDFNTRALADHCFAELADAVGDARQRAQAAAMAAYAAL
jgi:hypothetical protein